jgi:hypothetical protein
MEAQKVSPVKRRKPRLAIPLTPEQAAIVAEALERAKAQLKKLKWDKPVEK